MNKDFNITLEDFKNAGYEEWRINIFLELLEKNKNNKLKKLEKEIFQSMIIVIAKTKIDEDFIF